MSSERAFLYDGDDITELNSVPLAFDMVTMGVFEYIGYYIVFGEIRHKFRQQ